MDCLVAFVWADVGKLWHVAEVHGRLGCAHLILVVMACTVDGWYLHMVTQGGSEAGSDVCPYVSAGYAGMLAEQAGSERSCSINLQA